jgi:tetratricopeptide (TPR) repeat protein
MHYNLGNAYFLNAQYDSAQLNEEIALKSDAANTVIMKDLARVYFFEKKFAEAIALCKHILVLQPMDADACIDIASAFYNNQRFDSCIHYLYTAVGINPSANRAYEYLSICYKSMGKADSSKKYENIALKNNPAFKL